MRISQTKRILIISVLVCVFVIAALIGMWYLIGQQGIALKSNMQAVQDKEELSREQFKLQAILDETVAERDRLRSHVLEGEEGAVKLLSTVDEVAADLGITLETKRLAVRDNKGGLFNTLVIDFSLKGSERSVMKALQLLELMPYRSHLDRISMSRERNVETGTLVSQIELTMHVSIIK